MGLIGKPLESLAFWSLKIGWATLKPRWSDSDPPLGRLWSHEAGAGRDLWI